MRYMIIVRGTENFAASGPPPGRAGRSNREARGGSGEERYDGFVRRSQTHVVGRARARHERGDHRDRRPVTESKEVIGGFSIFNIASKPLSWDQIRRVVIEESYKTRQAALLQ